MVESQVIAWLNAMSHKQFAEFFYRAVSDRNTSDVAEWDGHFILADAEHVPDEDWDVDMIALHDPDEYDTGWADDSPLCQSGTCPNCGANVRSVAKHALCPVCNSKTYCT